MNDRMPIEMFLKVVLSHPRAIAITSEWQVAPERIHNIVAGLIKEIGINIVLPAQEKVVFNAILGILKTSPEINSAVKKGNTDARTRKAQTRHHAA